jgi:hypothetical protein
MLRRLTRRVFSSARSRTVAPLRPKVTRRLAVASSGLGLVGLGLGAFWRAEAKSQKKSDVKLDWAFKTTQPRNESKLSVAEATSVLKNYYPFFTWLEVCSEPFIKRMFENGRISRPQLEEIVSKLNGGVTSECYNIIAGPGMEEMAMELMRKDPQRFTYFPTDWRKFPDGSDNITVGGFHPINRIKDQNLLFLASFHSNDATMSQFHVMTMLAESFPKHLTVCLPFYPTATMERVTREGVCATANTTARFFSGLPTTGRPNRIMIYDLHTLQNRFYLAGNAHRAWSFCRCPCI